jgi:hypothetical protein
VSDDENSQAATNDAFDVLYYIARKRLAAGNHRPERSFGPHVARQRSQAPASLSPPPEE